MKTPLKMNVNVGEDRLVRLPDDVPVGPAEIIVLVGESTSAGVPLDDFEPMVMTGTTALSELVIEGRG